MHLISSASNAGSDLLSRRTAPQYTAYGQLFAGLPAWKPARIPARDTEAVEDFLYELSTELYRYGGGDNAAIPAAYTYLGQFITHDVTYDPLSSLAARMRPSRLRNFRTPRLDLDCVYGRGPADQPYLYQRSDPRLLLVGSNSQGDPDLPRSRDDSADRATTGPHGRQRPALIGDVRNDENILVSQMHLAFLGFHNSRVLEGMSFEEALRSTRWHYQWVVIHDFLKKLCGFELVHEVLGKRGTPKLQFFKVSKRPSVPVEFAFGAFRAGHSMVRDAYHLNDAIESQRKGVPIPIFKDRDPRSSLEGGRELPPGWTVQWDRFLPYEGSTPQLSKQIDLGMALPLRTLPLQEDNLRHRSLSYRTLLRCWRLGMPSGQQVARKMKVSDPLDGNDPLWVYVMREARDRRRGRRLGPVGARIVAEVLVGLLASDPTSFYASKPSWQPELPPVGGDRVFRLGDFLVHAGARMQASPPASRSPTPRFRKKPGPAPSGGGRGRGRGRGRVQTW